MLVRMADTKASAAARELLRQRWGNRVVSRAAQTVIDRADELPADLAEQVHAATEPQLGVELEEVL
jgi:hypothetical protein